MGGAAYIDGVAYDQFNNFYFSPFELDGFIWDASEHYYQASKFKDINYKRIINKERDPYQWWILGQSREHELIDNFESEKEKLMYQANYAKYTQNPPLKQLLISTYNKPIYFYNSTSKWNKANAEILTQLRQQFINESDTQN